MFILIPSRGHLALIYDVILIMPGWWAEIEVGMIVVMVNLILL